MAMRVHDAFSSSVMARSAAVRLVAAAAVVAGLWGIIAWAVALP
jgi:hypothetical protein